MNDEVRLELGELIIAVKVKMPLNGAEQPSTPILKLSTCSPGEGRVLNWPTCVIAG